MYYLIEHRIIGVFKIHQFCFRFFTENVIIKLMRIPCEINRKLSLRLIIRETKQTVIKSVLNEITEISE